jgi:hypothetical protein
MASSTDALLTPQQRQRAAAATDEMSERLQVAPNYVRLVVVQGKATELRIVAIDASPNGQFIGLYRDILERRKADPDWYTLDVLGDRVDPLAACTRAAYEAMIDEARSRGVRTLPDSLALNQQNGHVWTATMLTGEALPAPGLIWIASSSGGPKVNFVEHPIGRGGRSFRVRPTVAIGVVSLEHE